MQRKVFILQIVLTVACIALWLFFMIQNEKLGLILTNIKIPIMMFFASFIAGSTAEGGGAVAFPIMTLFFKITPQISRDFSFLIQSFGMSFASIFIYLNRIKVLNSTILIACIGGSVGIIIGFNFIEGMLPANYLKMFFTCFWLTFAISLFKNKDRTFKQNKKELDVSQNKLILIFVSLIGGIVSSQLGSGIDIIIFSLLTLAFGIDIKIAIPTSVVIMTLTSIFASLTKVLSFSIEPLAIDYLICAIPIVIIGAPLGAWVINKSSKKLAMSFLVFSIIAQFVASLILIEQTFELITFNLASLIFGTLLFASLNAYRKKRDKIII